MLISLADLYASLADGAISELGGAPGAGAAGRFGGGRG